MLKLLFKTCTFLVLLLFVKDIMGQRFELIDSIQIKELKVKSATYYTFPDTSYINRNEVKTYDINGQIISDSQFIFTFLNRVIFYYYKKHKLIRVENKVFYAADNNKSYYFYYFYNKKNQIRKVISYAHTYNRIDYYSYPSNNKVKIIHENIDNKYRDSTIIFYNLDKTIESELYYPRGSLFSIRKYGYNSKKQVISIIDEMRPCNDSPCYSQCFKYLYENGKETTYSAFTNKEFKKNNYDIVYIFYENGLKRERSEKIFESEFKKINFYKYEYYK